MPLTVLSEKAPGAFGKLTRSHTLTQDQASKRSGVFKKGLQPLKFKGLDGDSNNVVGV